MKLEVDMKTDALYLLLAESDVVESEEVAPGIVLDFDEREEVVAVEVLHLSRRSDAWGKATSSRRTSHDRPAADHQTQGDGR